MLYVVSQSNEHLEPLELNPWRVLVIAAHPGDIESGASAAVAKWTDEGAEVIYLIATRGELSIPGVEPADAALIRSGEQSAAAAAVGVRVVDFLDVDDGAVEPSVPLRREIVRDIRRFRPDVVMTMNHREQESDGTLNDADHRAIGIAALDAIRSAANQWAFRDIGQPHSVDIVLVAGSPAATHSIDVSEFEAHAARAFSAQKQHLASLGDHPMADESWLLSTLRTNGNRLPVERIEYAQGRPCHSSVVKEFEDADGRPRVMKLPKKAEQSTKPARARNAAPTPKKTSRRSKAKPEKTTAVRAGAMKFEARLEQNGRSIGIEVPASVMERLGGEQRPDVVVEINDTDFETTIGTSNGRRFIAINAERRKVAGIAVDDTFFIALSSRSSAEVVEANDAEEPAVAVVENTPKRKQRKRTTKPRSKA